MTPSFEKIKAVTSSVTNDNKKGKKKEVAGDDGSQEGSLEWENKIESF